MNAHTYPCVLGVGCPEGGPTELKTLTAARDYIDRGWHAVALKPRSKQPVTSWKNSVTVDDVSETFASSGRNIAIVLGAPSQGLVDIDLD